MRQRYRSVGVLLVLAGVAFGALTGCADTVDATPDSTSAVRTDALRERAEICQPYLEAFHRRTLAARVTPVDLPAGSESTPRQRIPIYASRAEAWEITIVGDTEYFVNTAADGVGEQWFVSADVLRIVDNTGGPYELTAQEKIVVKYEDRVLGAIKKSKKPDVDAPAVVDQLDSASTLFEITTSSLHARVTTIDGKLFVKVSDGLYAHGWYSAGQFDG